MPRMTPSFGHPPQGLVVAKQTQPTNQPDGIGPLGVQNQSLWIRPEPGRNTPSQIPGSNTG
ncbi:hypothetical protein EMCG_04348 [[Emmonsia] crescens]|uniref:Uncharacterized protein n=1 Tax=[Emmonsia] crescens TaxID=73230 RepID=A0A0G2HSC1_9EURO|nr:hypothetical protein EMCG_04348 [Emmonsia crescens UAMH 3008]